MFGNQPGVHSANGKEGMLFIRRFQPFSSTRNLDFLLNATSHDEGGLIMTSNNFAVALTALALLSHEKK